MNNKIKFSLLILVVAATTSLAVFKMKSAEIKFSEGKEIENEAAEERAEFEGAANWWNNMRSNQITHSIDIADVIQARKDANLFLTNKNRSVNLTWEELGPDNVGGRTRAILFDNVNPNHVLAGSVSGGLWESFNLGQSWNRIVGFSDATIWDNQNISCIAQTANGDIYVGTGEYFGWFTTSVVAGATGFPGNGIWKSTDHGATWSHVKSITTGTYTPTTSSAWSFITSMTSGGTAHPNRIYATIKGAGSNAGLVYTDDGSTWTNCSGAGISNLGASVAVGTNGIVHAIIGNKYFHSDPNAADPSVSLISTGITGLPGGVARMAVAVAPSDPNYVYVIASSAGQTLTGVYKSTDGGYTFSQIGPGQSGGSSVNWNPITQGSYSLALGVLPSNPNVIFIGGIDCYKYDLQTNGSYAWTKISNWRYQVWSSLYIHADFHSFVFHPTNPNIMFIGTDGGLSMTTNASAPQPYFGTRNLGYNVTQFYSCDARENTGVFVAGAQDNGNFRVDFSGNTTKTGVEIKGGDGGDVQVSKVNPNTIFAEYVTGSVERSSNNGQSFQSFFDTHIDNVDEEPGGNKYPDEGAAFIAPILLWENVAGDTDLNLYSKFFLGTNGNVWMTQQAMNYSVTPAWFKLNSTGLGVVISLAVTNDGKSVFAGTEGGNVYRIDGLDTLYSYPYTPGSFGITTTLIHSFGNRYVTGLTVSKSDPNHLIVTLGNYGNTDYVYESTDALAVAPAFQNITGTGFPKMPVYCSAIDPTNANKIIIGTELGIWATENGGTLWSEQNNTMARVPVTKFRQITVGNNLNVIYASTYGNGVWRTFSESVLSAEEPKLTNSSINVFPNPATDNLNFVIQNTWGNKNVVTNLIDASGRMIKSKSFGNLALGVFNLNLNISDVSNGTYVLQIISGNEQSVSKVVIAK